MGNEAREVVGELDCPYCRQRCLVKKNAKGKLYFVCVEHGINHMNTPPAQTWILEHMRATGSGAQTPATGVPPSESQPEEQPPVVDDPLPVVVEAQAPAAVPVVAAAPPPVVRRRPPKKPRPAPAAQKSGSSWVDDL